MLLLVMINISMSKKCFVDTSAFVALINPKDACHQKAVQINDDLSQKGVSLYTSDYILDETLTLIVSRQSHYHSVQFLDWVHKAVSRKQIHLLFMNEGVFQKAERWFRKFSDHPLSFTDCTTVAFVKEYKINGVFSFDDDFEKVGVVSL